MAILQPLADHLGDLETAHRRRSLQPRSGHDFASNDYLGLRDSARLISAVRDALDRGIGIGSGGSRLLRGNDPEHEALESEAAAFFGAEAALFFATGYAANAALLATLPQRGDLIVHDALIHASAHDGIRLARCPAVVAEHGDAQAVEDAIRRYRGEGGTGTPWIAVESLYSMDGDRAPLEDLAAIAARHGAMLLIDEAHATGVFGPDGRGLAAEIEGGENVITLHTCGKALGCEGALVCGPRTAIDFLVNRARPFIFSTAPSPLMAAAVREALRIVADEPERRRTLLALARHAGQRLARHGATATGSQILPLILGEEVRTMAVATTLQRQGYDIRGIRPPTVPAGTSRLRLSITTNIGMDTIDALDAALAQGLR
ncbi:8-amino-7-oxononanoate synthase [Stakelama saccharophila]|uniref:8-amino-7-oxononanoate synthase n=1 Tax=Stakelama saccharophila TaxID=3075605 RepID=A0ABZ0BAS2_9SPHN|nr:8-amino-7-oxononanoate synthase [Stakelama sp. W311]WNO54379.1 8-amino-7-oxononanoate synthase [Stakelama sp. W311]